MTKNKDSRPSGQDATSEALLGLLMAFCSTMGQTFSWYTSRAGRQWLALKSNRPYQYATNVEYQGTTNDKDMLDTFALLYAAHLDKVLEIAPPVSTWISGQRTLTERDDAWTKLEGYYPELREKAEREGWPQLLTLQQYFKAFGIHESIEGVDF